MKPFSFQELKPFECELIGDSVFVHFGVFVCSAINSLDSIFVPVINKGSEEDPKFEPLKQNGDPEAYTTNIIGVENKGVIYFEVSLSKDFYEDALVKWREGLFERSPEKAALYADVNFSQQEFDNYFKIVRDSDLLSEEFSPLVNSSPIITKVEIKYLEVGDLTILEDFDTFNFIVIEADTEEPAQDETIVSESGEVLVIKKEKENKEAENDISVYGKKSIPLAIIDKDGENKITQLFAHDYFFSFPTQWVNTSAETFFPDDN